MKYRLLIFILLILYFVFYIGVLYTNYKGIDKFRNFLIVGMVATLITWGIFTFLNNNYYEEALNVYKKFQEHEGEIKAYETLYESKFDDMKKVKRELENMREKTMNIELEEAWKYIYTNDTGTHYTPEYEFKDNKLNMKVVSTLNTKDLMIKNYNEVVLKFLNTLAIDSSLYISTVNSFKKLDKKLKKDKDGKFRYDITNVLRKTPENVSKIYDKKDVGGGDTGSCDDEITSKTLENILQKIREFTKKDKRNSDIILFKEAYNIIVNAFYERAQLASSVFQRPVSQTYASHLYDLQLGKQYLKVASNKIDEARYNEYKFLKKLGEKYESGLGPTSGEVMRKSVFVN